MGGQIASYFKNSKELQKKSNNVKQVVQML